MENSGFQTLAKQETKTPQSNKHPQTQNTTQNKKPASVWNVKREVKNSVLQDTTQYCKVLLQYYSSTRKDYSVLQSTTLCYKVLPRRLRRDRLLFTSAVSHQDQWWSSCACALHLLARETVHSDAQPNHLLLPTPYLCVTRTYPILSFLLSPAPPRHECILNGTWRCHRTFPVASRYRYIPNTLGRKRSR